jgi:diguanylate cyclase (GGDEF)-like protein
MMDMDGVKPVNDEHGHQFGSYCISEAGKIIKRCLPVGSSGARFGGDEFVAFLPGFELDAACELAELIRSQIECFEFKMNEICVAPTISIGVAELQAGVQSAEELTRLADDALYRAKKAGKNQVWAEFS